MNLTRRAEANNPANLIATFVDVGPLFNLLSTIDHQVMYGRRGTGKTHALFFLAERKKGEGDATVYIDMRTIGSSGGIYSDQSLPINERATRLLIDTLTVLHDGLTEFFVEHSEAFDLSYTGPLLDNLADAMTEVRVVGAVERQETTLDNSETENKLGVGISANLSGVSAGVDASSGKRQLRQTQQQVTETGMATHTVHFGAVGRTLQDLTQAIEPNRMWILLDEWSHVPTDLQPYLADFIRRSLLPVRGITVKIAAIEQRTQFRIPLEPKGGYIGIELGADATADINLDDFMVLDVTQFGEIPTWTTGLNPLFLRSTA